MFVQFFYESEISIQFCIFYTQIDFFEEKNILGHNSTFCKLWSQTRWQKRKKTKNLLLWTCLRIPFCNYPRVTLTQMLKLLHPNEHFIYWEIDDLRKLMLVYPERLLNQVLCFKGTVSPAQNRLNVVWLDRAWLGHPSLYVFKFFLLHLNFWQCFRVINCLALITF